MNAEPDIAIIGAGAAGIGAARRLAGTGRSVVILDALPRPGGRAWTCETSAGPVDLGCGWLHSGDRNPWVGIAAETGFAIHRGPTAWGEQFRNLGFSADEQRQAWSAFEDWSERIATAPPESDRAMDAVRPGEPWLAYLQALSGYISGDELQRISAKDYAAYDAASTDNNWRAPAGYGALIAAALPPGSALSLSTAVEAVALDNRRVAVRTRAGTLHPHAAIVTASTNVIAGSAISWPAALDPWRDAAARLPLGANEKLYFEILADSPFEPETHVIGNPRDPATGSFYIRPLGRPTIECFLGGEGARIAAAEGQAAAFDRALAVLSSLFGASTRRFLRPLLASDWTGTPSIGGGYSHALPGQSQARLELARPCENRIFFAGEATQKNDFSTAHGAYASGVRAAEEALAAFAGDRR